VHIEAVIRPHEFPAGPLTNHLSENIVPAPNRLKLRPNLVLSTIPLQTAIIHQAQPDFLKELRGGPLDVIKDSIVPLHPQSPNNSAMNGHPNLGHFDHTYLVQMSVELNAFFCFLLELVLEEMKKFRLWKTI
jgi:hypothetical protein